MSDVPREFVFTRYPARQGMVWLRDGVHDVQGSTALAWVVLVLGYFLVLLLCACSVRRAVRDDRDEARVRGRPARGRVEAGARRHARAARICSRDSAPICGRCVAIGVFFVAGITIAVFASSLVDGGKLIELMASGGVAERGRSSPRRSPIRSCSSACCSPRCCRCPS